MHNGIIIVVMLTRIFPPFLPFLFIFFLLHLSNSTNTDLSVIIAVYTITYFHSGFIISLYILFISFFLWFFDKSLGRDCSISSIVFLLLLSSFELGLASFVLFPSTHVDILEWMGVAGHTPICRTLGLYASQINRLESICKNILIVKEEEKLSLKWTKLNYLWLWVNAMGVAGRLLLSA